jgi:hypothetical protein
MARSSIDLSGLIVGRLTVLEKDGFRLTAQQRKDTVWRCLCSCGNTVFVRQSKLRVKTSPTRSCGCLRDDLSRLRKNGYIHGESKTLLYGLWHGIKDRCKNMYGEKNKHYKGKGIKVCDEWASSYLVFREWALANGYKKGLSLDRIDGNKNYEPSNCRFVTMEVQQNNRSNNRNIEAFGETKTLAQWLKDPRCKIGRESLKDRLKYNWDIEKAIITPPTRAYIK